MSKRVNIVDELAKLGADVQALREGREVASEPPKQEEWPRAQQLLEQWERDLTEGKRYYDTQGQRLRTVEEIMNAFLGNKLECDGLKVIILEWLEDGTRCETIDGKELTTVDEIRQAVRDVTLLKPIPWALIYDGSCAGPPYGMR